MSAHGCFNRPLYRASMKVQDGHWDDGVQRIPKLVSIPFRMNPDCQYRKTDLGKADAKCIGCKHRKAA